MAMAFGQRELADRDATGGLGARVGHAGDHPPTSPHPTPQEQAPATPSTLPSSDQEFAMADIKGPTVDAEAFRAEGHCCGIRLPVLTTLTETGIPLELTPEARAQLVAEGVLPDESQPEPARK